MRRLCAFAQALGAGLLDFMDDCIKLRRFDFAASLLLLVALVFAIAHPAGKNPVAQSREMEYQSGTMGKVGRPRIFASPADHEKALVMLKVGASRRDICKVLMISYDTFGREIRRDPAFRQAVEQAETEGKIEALTLIFKAGRKDWRAADRWLELKFPRDFGALSIRSGTAEAEGIDDLQGDLDELEAAAANGVD
jgi:hypothetical protein